MSVLSRVIKTDASIVLRLFDPLIIILYHGQPEKSVVSLSEDREAHVWMMKV